MSRAKREWGVGKVSFAVLGGSITRHESLSPDTLKCQGFKIFQNNECFVDCSGGRGRERSEPSEARVGSWEVSFAVLGGSITRHASLSPARTTSEIA